MLVQISEIRINAGRREADPESVQELADSISKVGLLNPITVDQEHMLIAGLHRLEAAKSLGWTEIECTVSSLEGLLAELAEVDENVVRKGLSAVEYSDLLLRRKDIYEMLHPETKNGGDRKSEKIRIAKCNSDSAKPFIQDTAEKLGVHPTTVARQIQTAKNLTTEAKDIIRDTGTKITKKDALKLSRLEPEQQKEAASQLAAGDIHSMDQYHPTPAEPEDPSPPEPEAPASSDRPYTLGGKHYATLEESIADLKNPDKDCSYTPDTLLADIDGFVDTFHKNFAWYSDPFCTVVFPSISQVQFEFIRQRFASIFSAMEDLITLPLQGLIHNHLYCRRLMISLRQQHFKEVLNIDTMTRNEAVSNAAEPEKGYRLTIGRSIIRVVSVFNGTKTASEAIHEAAMKKILFEKSAG